MGKNPGKENKFFSDIIEQLAANSIFGLAGTIINASVTVIILWRTVDRSRLLLWFISLLLISMVRIYLQINFNKFKSVEKSLNSWKNYFLLTLSISGIIWGLSGIILFPENSIAHQSFLAFILGGMVAGSVGVYSARLMAFLLFSVPALFPLIARLVFIYDPIHLSMAFMLFLFWLIMLFTARKLHMNLLKSFELKYENIDLISSLKSEIAAKNIAEAKLANQKDKVEKLVDLRTKELQESEVKYRQLVESINDVIFSVDAKGILTYISPVVKNILGYEPSEIIGKNFMGYIHEEDKANIQKKWAKAISGDIEPSEYRLMAKSGAYHWIRSSSKPIYEKGHIVGLRGVFIDITESINLQDQLRQAQKMESIGNLAGGIAHDFNNILSSIIGYTELALEEVPKGSSLDDSLHEVYVAGKRARDLVKHILAFARQSDEKLIPIRPGMVAEEVLQLIRSTIPSTIEIRQNIDSVSVILGNTTQIHQVLMNLCTNAAYAMEVTGGVLELNMRDLVVDKDDLWAGLRQGKYVEIKVSDTGAGIAPENIKSIFEPYFTTKGPGEGTGMGLAMAQGVIESYGGKIYVKSQLGEGTTFKIYLPVTKERSEYGDHVPEELPKGSERILFVDDEAPIAKISSRTLEFLGYSVTTRTSSIEALELFKAKPNDFDLIITDMTMPNMTGDKLAIELIKIQPNIPVILCTGYSKNISDETASQAGIKAFAYKPMVKAELAKTVRKVLDEAKG